MNEDKSFLVVQNDPNCPAGTCADLLRRAGHRLATAAPYLGEELPAPEGFAGIIVLGGEMGAHDRAAHPHLDAVLSLIAGALACATPMLGICLGGQLLALAAGGAVSSPSPHGEHGVCRVELNGQGRRDPLFAGVPASFVTFQLHNDSFTVPPGATLLAGSPACPAQAFRLGNAVYGLQFHPEVDPAIVACWDRLSLPATGHLQGFLAAKAPFDAASQAIVSNFIALAAAPASS